MTTIASPTWVSPAYADRDAVWRQIIAGSPYPIMMGAAGYGEMMSGFLPPWFRAHWALDGQAIDEDAMALLHHEPFIEGAKALFGADVVRPATLLVNLMGPMASGVPHVDTPTFRGLKRSEVPIWLFVTMGASGLFERWAVQVATALTWFYDGDDGEFEYWPPGQESSEVVRGPFGNAAILSDGDRMRHRVGAIGDHEAFDARVELSPSSTIEWTDRSDWLIRTDRVPSTTLAAGEVRVSVLWKALTFADADAAARFDDHEDDIDTATIVSTFLADLRARGIAADDPTDPFTDPAWSSLLTGVYLQLPS